MNKPFILIAKSYSRELYFSKNFKEEANCLNFGEGFSRSDKGDIITYLKRKSGRHRWDIDIIDDNEGIKHSCIIVDSKKNAIFAKKKLMEYDDSLKIEITKVY